MKFFDELLSDVENLLSDKKSVSYPLGEPWQDVGRNEVVLQRDTEFELDGIGFNLVTSKSIGSDQVIVFGPELDEITTQTKYNRISVIQMEDIQDEQKAYNAIRKIEYSKYHYFPKGFMIRTASTSHKEKVRVSKSALSDGLSFRGVGNLLINKYKENSVVKAVKVIYITDETVDFDALEKTADKNYNITETLNHILSNVNFDCSSCNLKPICDEVEGMRELHFKNAGM